MSNIAFTLRLEPPPVVFDLYGPDDELLHLTPPAQADQLIGFVGPSGTIDGTVEAGDGIEVVGSEIRIDIDNLPSAP